MCIVLSSARAFPTRHTSTSPHTFYISSAFPLTHPQVFRSHMPVADNDPSFLLSQLLSRCAVFFVILCLCASSFPACLVLSALLQRSPARARFLRDFVLAFARLRDVSRPSRISLCIFLFPILYSMDLRCSVLVRLIILCLVLGLHLHVCVFSFRFSVLWLHYDLTSLPLYLYYFCLYIQHIPTLRIRTYYYILRRVIVI